MEVHKTEENDLTMTNNASRQLVMKADWYKQLKPRQRKFLKKYIQTKNRVTAWFETYRCKNRMIAAISVYRFMKTHPEIVDFFYQMAGIGDDDIVKVISESMESKRQQIYRDKVYEFPDPYARMKAAELAMKVRGTDKPNIQTQNNVVIIADPNKGVYKVVDGEEETHDTV